MKNDKDFEFKASKIVTNENISYLIAYYETYYQLAYGFFISYSCGFDVGDSTKKVEELRPSVAKEYIVDKIVELFEECENMEEMKGFFTVLAAKKALEDFIREDPELCNKHIFESMMLEMIANKTLFSEQLGGMFTELFPIRLNIWKGFVGDETLNDISAAIKTHRYDVTHKGA